MQQKFVKFPELLFIKKGYAFRIGKLFNNVSGTPVIGQYRPASKPYVLLLQYFRSISCLLCTVCTKI